MARELSRRSARAMVFVGDDGDRALVAKARAAMAGTRCIDVAGRLPVGALGAAIEGADLLLGNNSGPMHMAAALGVPVVSLYALTHPQHTPWQVPARVLNYPVDCRHCLRSVCPLATQDCLQRVSEVQVVAAALDLLHQTQRTAQGAPQRTTERTSPCARAAGRFGLRLSCP